MSLLLMILLLFKHGYCQTEKTVRRIYAGYPDTDNKIPYVVCIEQSMDSIYVRFCSGILIERNWVLTAGHCIRENLNLTVTYRGSRSKSIHRLHIILKIRHPNYQSILSSTNDLTIFNDIGLLKVEQVQIRTFADLSSESYDNFLGLSVTFAGYGNNWNKSEASTVDEWKYKKLKLNNSPLLLGEGVVAECEVRKLELISLCVRGPISSTRQGDSGGPLVLDGMVIGIHSGKIKDEMRFVAVSPYLSWIDETIEKYRQ